MSVISIRSKHDFVWCAADKRLPMSTANQKQALVHIYNIVTGSNCSYLDNQFKAEEKLQAIKSCWIQRFWFQVFKIKCSVVCFGY
jgi:hypothetical protein